MQPKNKTRYYAIVTRSLIKQKIHTPLLTRKNNANPTP